MAFLWNDDFSVGIDKIDDQHKELIYRADQLFEAGKNGKGKEYIAQLIDFLEDYTKKHFRDEEILMADIKYPNIESHKLLHARFVEDIMKLKKDYEESGGNILVVLNANKIIVDWLIHHIYNQDRKIGEFSRKKVNR